MMSPDYSMEESSGPVETEITDPVLPPPKRSSFSKFNKPKLIRAAVIFACLIIIFAVGFFVLKNNNFKADVVTKTITISGNYIDTISLKPVVGASISVGFAKNAPVEVKTDSSGKYSTSITINYDDAVENVIAIQAKAQGYADGVLYTTVGTANLIENMDFKLSMIPIDAVSTKSLDLVSARCRTTIDSYDYVYDRRNILYHPGDYKGQIIDGVLFCASEQNAIVFTNYTQDIKTTASQINSLVSRTGLSYTPTIYLTGTITWISGAAAYSDAGTKELIINVSYLNDISVITHEFGHLVDWDKGMDGQTNSTGSRCYKNKITNIPHCYLSTRNDFSKIYAYLKYYDTFIKGYAASSPFEFFAELFASQQLPDAVDSNNFSARERLQYDIRNAFSGSYSDAFGATQKYKSSTINPNTFLSSVFPQNMAVYAYKFVASTSGLDQYFQGTLNQQLSLDAIKTGQFTDKAVVSIHLTDQFNKPLAEALINVGDGSANGKTLSKKDTGVFADNSGDLFDTTGTLVLQNTTIGKQTLTVKLPTGEAFISEPIDLRAGANGAIYLKVAALSKVTLRPTSDAFNPDGNAVPSAGTDLFAMVNEVTPDDYTTFISPSGTFANVMFGHDAHGIPTDMTITGVKIFARLSGINLAYGVYGANLLGIYHNNHVDFGSASDASTSISDSWTVLSQNFPVCPFDNNNPWTFADLDAMAFGGVFGNTVSGPKMTQIYAEVSFGRLDILKINNSFVGATAAKVQTQAPISIGSFTTGAVITAQGNVITDGGGKIIMTGFMVSKDKINSQRYNNPILASIGPFTMDITKLDLDATYYIQAFAENSVGIGYGDWIEFKTLPLVVALEVAGGFSEVTADSATLTGCVTAADGTIITSRGFYYSVGSVVKTNVENGNFGLACFTQKITGLKPGSIYSFSTFVTTASGEKTESDPVMSFKTLPQAAPKVTTLPPTDITAKSIVPHGNITDTGGATATKRGFRLTKVQNTVQADYNDSGNFDIGEFTKANVTLSLPNTIYYIQAYATNSAGTTYGAWLSFKSLPLALPKVTTLAPTNIMANSVLPHGNISDTGGASVTKRGFQVTRVKGTVQANYSESGSFGTGDFAKTNVSLYFSNSTYYVRAYATNSVGTAYGDWVEFKTLSK